MGIKNLKGSPLYVTGCLFLFIAMKDKKHNLQSKIFSDADQLSVMVKNWQNASQKVVMTNGCFDILHMGHVMYLEEAGNEGDKLIVALNSDDSVRRLKGPNRPVNDETCRTYVIAGLGSVDAVILFHEDTPLSLIKKINPDVLVKGGDYPIAQIVGSEHVMSYGGKVKTLSLIDGYSTTRIEQKLKNQC